VGRVPFFLVAAMAQFAVFLLASTGLLASLVTGVSITADNGLMRRELKDAVELQASGAMQSTPSKQVHTNGTTGGTVSTAKPDWRDCDSDFPIGKDGCNCEEGHEMVEDEELCMLAATEAGVTAPSPNAVFKIQSPYFHIRPMGCFKFPCNKHESPNGICYFYNPIGVQPAKCGGPKLKRTKDDGTIEEYAPEVEGLPVCRRAKYLNGTKDSKDADGTSHDELGGCPTGYAVIKDQDKCTLAANCGGFCQGSDFVIDVKNESRHNDFPEGCFIHDSEDSAGRRCVYYNAPLPPAASGTSWPTPTNVKGKSICNVTTITDFRHVGELADGGNTSDTHARTTTAAPIEDPVTESPGAAD